MNIIFYNPCRNGDIHVSRGYILDIINKLPEHNFFYAQHPFYATKDFLLKDIPNLKLYSGVYNFHDNSSITIDKDNIYINTWYGQDNFKYFELSKSEDCSFYILHEIFRNVYKYFNLELDTFDKYLPKINFDNLELDIIDSFLEKINGFDKKILVCTNPVHSSQSQNFDFNPIINIIASEYPNYAFIITADIQTSKNIFKMKDVIDVNCDLNEISYLSKFCDVIIGRSSGAYTFSLIDENINNINKKFVCFAKTKTLSVALRDGDYKSQVIWSDDYSGSNIYLKIKEAL
jgi:hypothetical protein